MNTRKNKPSKTSENFKKDLLDYMNKFGTPAWTDGRLFKPTNFTGLNNKGVPYHGWNQFLTNMQMKLRGFDSRTFLTYHEISKRGGMIKKGEKCCVISCPKKCLKAKEDGHIVKAEEKKHMTEDEYYESIKGFGLNAVFNLAQTTLEYEHIKFGEPREESKIDRNLIDEVLKAINSIDNPPEIIFANVKSPYYNTLTDQIFIPPVETYETDAYFISSLLHEYGHALGAECRTNRKSLTGSGKENYQLDELVAEMFSSVSMDLFGFKHSEYAENNKAYTKYWLNAIPVIEGFERMISRAYSHVVDCVKYAYNINLKEN